MILIGRGLDFTRELRSIENGQNTELKAVQLSGLRKRSERVREEDEKDDGRGQTVPIKGR